MWSLLIIIISSVIYLLSFARMMWYTRKVFNDPYMGIDFTDFIQFSVWTYVPLLNTIGAILTFTKRAVK